MQTHTHKKKKKMNASPEK